MKIKKISPSSYNSWDGCQHRYFLEQNLKYTFPAGKAADIGTVVHKVLEILALVQLKIQEQDNTPLKVKDTEIDIDNYTITELLHLSMSGFKEGYFDGKDIETMQEYLKRALSFNNGEYDPRNRKILAPEKRVKVEIPEEWAKNYDGSQFYLSGIVDLVTEVDENTIEIIDYKTGQPKDWNTGKVKKYKDFFEDPQLRFYHWAATRVYGEYKNFIVSILFFKTQDYFSIPFSSKDLEKTEQLLKDRYHEIKNCNIPKLNISWKCTKFCPFGKLTTEGTNLPQLTQEEIGGIASRGSPMTMCDCSIYNIHLHGIDYVEENMGKYKKNE